MKQKLLIVFGIIIVLSLIVTGSYAYVTREGNAENVITTGKVDFEIVEKTDDDNPFPEEGVSEVLPGDIVTKKVTVKNTGNQPIYARIKLVKGVSIDKLSAEECMKLVDLNTTDWTYRDGFYYYNTELAAGQETKPLFTKVEFVGDKVGNEYRGATFTLDVDAQGVQTKNNGTDVFSATGWSSQDD